jgi:toxin ParE1/3/4
MYEYILEPRAQKEYESSVHWYLTQSEKATENFVKSVEESINLVCRQPQQYRNAHKNFHEITTKNYPFVIIYTIEENTKTVVIFSIFHKKRNPKTKYK